MQPTSASLSYRKITASAFLLPKLRNYFAEFLDGSYLNALVCSTHPPVSVYGTITFSLRLEVFLVSVASAEHTSLLDWHAYHFSETFCGFSYKTILPASHSIHALCQPSFLRHPITLKVVQEYLTCFPSPTPIGLDLGYRLTQSG